jgi:hypothetical protein
MIDIIKKNIERAMLVSIDNKEFSKEVVEEHLNELEELASTAGAETVFKIIQSKARMDPAYYIGKGKAEELAQLIELNDINIIIFDVMSIICITPEKTICSGREEKIKLFKNIGSSTNIVLKNDFFTERKFPSLSTSCIFKIFFPIV